jgi:protein-disulfide isomerase
LVEYSDFQCPYCARFAKDTLPGIKAKYVTTGKLQIYFINNPLGIHSSAQKAAEALVCADRQGKGWEMHDALFDDQRNLDRQALVGRAAKLALDQVQFNACLNGEAESRVKTNASAAADVQMAATPGFLIGTILPDGRVHAVKRLQGARPESEFDKAIEPLLTQVAPH